MVGAVFVRRLTVALVTAATAATAGAATNTAGPPLLTYAVAPMYVGGWVSLGLCATDLQGKTFRLTDPHYNARPSYPRTAARSRSSARPILRDRTISETSSSPTRRDGTRTT